MVLDYIFASVHIILYNISYLCALHDSIAQSGAPFISAVFSRVTGRGSLWMNVVDASAAEIIDAQVLDESGTAGEGVFRGCSGPQRKMLRSIGLTISTTDKPFRLFLDPTICQSLSWFPSWDLWTSNLPGS